MHAPATTLVGREATIAQALELLAREDVRLLTITGPGGIGKTRLADAVAIGAADRFADGVVLVPLQSVSDPGLVLSMVARALGLYDGEGELERRLADHLDGRSLLIVIDNFEQVVDAASTVAGIAGASPGVKVVVTSRTPLHVAGERELPLDPLSRDDAVHVFLDRARAVRPDYDADRGDLEAIAEICDRLDCLPLAVELAAARTRMLSPAMMLPRLEHGLDLLTSGPRDAPARHRALRDTIAWSTELLGDDETALLGRLSVFAGGCTLDAVESVCGGDLDSLGVLVDQSLVRRDRERFQMLQTIREFAVEVLDARGDARSTRLAHAEYYFRLANGVAEGSAGTDRAVSTAALEAEHDNVRAALRFALDENEPELALDLCAALRGFWLDRGYLSEGRLWLDESLAAVPAASPTRARALSGNGILAHYQGDYDRAEALCREARELSLSLDDAPGIAEACTGLALVRRTRGDHRAAVQLFGEALAVHEALGQTRATARALDRLAMSFVVVGDLAAAQPLFARSLELSRELGDPHGVALGLYGLSISPPGATHPEALAQATESVDLLRQLGDRRAFGKALWSLACANAGRGAAETAAAQLEESLTLFLELGDRWFSALVLESAGLVAASVGDLDRAVRILGAAAAILEELDVPMWAPFRDRHDAVVDESRATLGADRYARAWNEGAELPAGDVVGLVAGGGPQPAGGAPEGLTAREVEVLVLVAEGLTDAEVAERLVVSLRTVHAHLRSVYRKLDVHTRSAATRYALERGLAPTRS